MNYEHSLKYFVAIMILNTEGFIACHSHTLAMPSVRWIQGIKFYMW